MKKKRVAKHYIVELTQRVVEGASVVVESVDQKTAEDMAISLAKEGRVSWSFLTAPESVEVVSCKVRP